MSRASADPLRGMIRRRTARIAAPEKAREARAGMAMSLATFAMAAASAIQAVLYLSLFGTSGRTDGFFVAFALYTTFGVFSQSLRLTSVPAARQRAHEQPRVRGRARAHRAARDARSRSRWPARSSQLLAPGLSADARAVTESALPVLGAAMALQLWAAGAATLLAIRAAFGARRGRLHRRRSRRPGHLPGAHEHGRRADARLVDAGHGRRDVRLDAGRHPGHGRARSRQAIGRGCVRARAPVRPDPRPDRHLPRLQHAVRDHARVRQPLGGGRRDGPVLQSTSSRATSWPAPAWRSGCRASRT